MNTSTMLKISIFVIVALIFSFQQSNHFAQSLPHVESCNLLATGICFNYVDGFTMEEKMQSCSNFNEGQFVAYPCSVEKEIIGKCTTNRSGKITETIFYTTQLPALVLRDHCANAGGTWNDN